jgi:hypothetical protein
MQVVASALSGYFTTPPPPTKCVEVIKILQIIPKPPTKVINEPEALILGLLPYIASFAFIFFLALHYSIRVRSKAAIVHARIIRRD